MCTGERKRNDTSRTYNFSPHRVSIVEGDEEREIARKFIDEQDEN